MTKGTIFSDEDFLCTVQIKQQQVFVPKDIANVYKAEQVCKKYDGKVYVYKNNTSNLINKFDETNCAEEYEYLLKEQNKSEKLLLIQIKFEKIILRKIFSKQKYNIICQRYKKSTKTGNNKSDKSKSDKSTSKPKIEGVAIRILITVTLFIFIPAVLYASVPSIRVS